MILLFFVTAVLLMTLMKWFRYEQRFIMYNYGLILIRIGYLVTSISFVSDYDSFLIMLVFMYIIYFVQLVRIDFVLVLYALYAIYDSIR